MLEQIKRLKNTINSDQLDEVDRILGKDLYSIFFDALHSENEDDAKSRMQSFSEALTSHPLKAFKLYGLLTKEQKDIVQNIIGS